MKKEKIQSQVTAFVLLFLRVFCELVTQYDVVYRFTDVYVFGVKIPTWIFFSLKKNCIVQIYIHNHCLLKVIFSHEIRLMCPQSMLGYFRNYQGRKSGLEMCDFVLLFVFLFF